MKNILYKITQTQKHYSNKIYKYVRIKKALTIFQVSKNKVTFYHFQNKWLI